ncbi:hypothetical protein B586_19905 [Mycobacterium haemophilum DSM 44634]|nr:hypothetical protein B586_19905 [Mycobacterium haemophilum DSM 44634]
MAMVTATANEANPMTANATTALLISNDRLLNRSALVSASASTYPPKSRSNSSISAGSNSASPAIEYASCGSSPTAAANSAAGTMVVSSPAASPAASAGWAIVAPHATGAAANAAPRASANVGSSATSTRMVDASPIW